MCRRSYLYKEETHTGEGKEPVMDGIKTNGTSTMDRVYQCIVGYFMENGYAPSIRDICAGTGLKSSGTVFYYLQRLEADGRIEVKRNSSRAIRLIGYEFRKAGE